jgi:hypothetical protein
MSSLLFTPEFKDETVRQITEIGGNRPLEPRESEVETLSSPNGRTHRYIVNSATANQPNAPAAKTRC